MLLWSFEGDKNKSWILPNNVNVSNLHDSKELRKTQLCRIIPKWFKLNYFIQIFWILTRKCVHRNQIDGKSRASNQNMSNNTLVEWTLVVFQIDFCTKNRTVLNVESVRWLIIIRNAHYLERNRLVKTFFLRRNAPITKIHNIPIKAAGFEFQCLPEKKKILISPSAVHSMLSHCK